MNPSSPLLDCNSIDVVLAVGIHVLLTCRYGGSEQQLSFGAGAAPRGCPAPAATLDATHALLTCLTSPGSMDLDMTLRNLLFHHVLLDDQCMSEVASPLWDSITVGSPSDVLDGLLDMVDLLRGSLQAHCTTSSVFGYHLRKVILFANERDFSALLSLADELCSLSSSSAPKTLRDIPKTIAQISSMIELVLASAQLKAAGLEKAKGTSVLPIVRQEETLLSSVNPAAACLVVPKLFCIRAIHETRRGNFSGALSAMRSFFDYSAHPAAPQSDIMIGLLKLEFGYVEEARADLLAAVGMAQENAMEEVIRIVRRYLDAVDAIRASEPMDSGSSSRGTRTDARAGDAEEVPDFSIIERSMLSLLQPEGNGS